MMNSENQWKIINEINLQIKKNKEEILKSINDIFIQKYNINIPNVTNNIYNYKEKDELEKIYEIIINYKSENINKYITSFVFKKVFNTNKNCNLYIKIYDYCYKNSNSEEFLELFKKTIKNYNSEEIQKEWKINIQEINCIDLQNQLATNGNKQNLPKI